VTQGVYPKIKATVGEEITITLANGLTVTGPVAELDTDVEGGVRVLAIREDPNRPDPLCVRGDLIVLWRFGPAVRQSPSGLHLAAPGLLGPNSRQ